MEMVFLLMFEVNRPEDGMNFNQIFIVLTKAAILGVAENRPLKHEIFLPTKGNFISLIIWVD